MQLHDLAAQSWFINHGMDCLRCDVRVLALLQCRDGSVSSLCLLLWQLAPG